MSGQNLKDCFLEARKLVKQKRRDKLSNRYMNNSIVYISPHPQPVTVESNETFANTLKNQETLYKELLKKHSYNNKKLPFKSISDNSDKHIRTAINESIENSAISSHTHRRQKTSDLPPHKNNNINLSQRSEEQETSISNRQTADKMLSKNNTIMTHPQRIEVQETLNTMHNDEIFHSQELYIIQNLTDSNNQEFQNNITNISQPRSIIDTTNNEPRCSKNINSPIASTSKHKQQEEVSLNSPVNVTDSQSIDADYKEFCNELRKASKLSMKSLFPTKRLKLSTIKSKIKSLRRQKIMLADDSSQSSRYSHIFDSHLVVKQPLKNNVTFLRESNESNSNSKCFMSYLSNTESVQDAEPQRKECHLIDNLTFFTNFSGPDKAAIEVNFFLIIYVK